MRVKVNEQQLGSNKSNLLNQRQNSRSVPIHRPPLFDSHPFLSLFSILLFDPQPVIQLNISPQSQNTSLKSSLKIGVPWRPQFAKPIFIYPLFDSFSLFFFLAPFSFPMVSLHDLKRCISSFSRWQRHCETKKSRHKSFSSCMSSHVASFSPLCSSCWTRNPTLDLRHCFFLNLPPSTQWKCSEGRKEDQIYTLFSGLSSLAASCTTINHPNASLTLDTYLVRCKWG